MPVEREALLHWMSEDEMRWRAAALDEVTPIGAAAYGYARLAFPSSGRCVPADRRAILRGTGTRRAAGHRMATDAIERVEVGGGIELAYETFGDPGRPLVLLVMGLGTQMLAWQDEFCAGLAARDLFVVRFDNRDVGLSTHLHEAPQPDIGAIFAGDRSTVSYTLSEMAADTVGLVDALGRDRVHLVGASMGGMIAQTVAIEHPERVASLTSCRPRATAGSATRRPLRSRC
jgi:alpha-beta hydrolase superfamily lysophospholipase